MSYILDALNKSEQERRDQKTPDLSTVHRAPPPKPQSKFPLVLVITVFAVINIAALGYWFMGSEAPATPNTTQTSTPATSPPTNTAQLPPVAATPAPKPTPAAEKPTPVQVAMDESVGTLITPQTAFQQTSRDPVRITELPLNVQRQIPDLVFSSHLYSEEPSFRMVNINGKMIREGDMVANELKLLEISEEGVILGFRHYVFEVSVLRDWSFN